MDCCSFLRWEYTTVSMGLGRWTLVADPRITVEAQASGGFLLRCPDTEDQLFKGKNARWALTYGEGAHDLATCRAAQSGESA